MGEELGLRREGCFAHNFDAHCQPVVDATRISARHWCELSLARWFDEITIYIHMVRGGMGLAL
jgi:hypothetical protein